MSNFVKDLYNFLGNWLKDKDKDKDKEENDISPPDIKNKFEEHLVCDSICFQRTHGSTEVLVDFEEWVSRHLNKPIQRVNGCPAFVIIQMSGSRTSEESDIINTNQTLRKDHPWVGLIILRYGGKDVVHEDYGESLNFNSVFRFLYNSQGLIECDYNEKMWKKLTNDFDNISKVIHSKKMKVEEQKKEKKKQKSIYAVRISGADEADPAFEQKLDQFLSIPVSKEDGTIAMVIMQLSGPRTMQDVEVKNKISELYKKFSKVILVGLRLYLTSSYLESEPQDALKPFDLYVRFNYSKTRGVYDSKNNEESFEALKEFVSKL